MSVEATYINLSLRFTPRIHGVAPDFICAASAGA